MTAQLCFQERSSLPYQASPKWIHQQQDASCLVEARGGGDLVDTDGGLLEAGYLDELLGGGGLGDLDELHGDLDALIVIHVAGLGALVVGLLDLASTAIEDLDDGGGDVASNHAAGEGVGGEGHGDSGTGGTGDGLTAVGRKRHLLCKRERGKLEDLWLGDMVTLGKRKYYKIILCKGAKSSRCLKAPQGDKREEQLNQPLAIKACAWSLQ